MRATSVLAQRLQSKASLRALNRIKKPLTRQSTGLAARFAYASKAFNRRLQQTSSLHFQNKFFDRIGTEKRFTAVQRSEPLHLEPAGPNFRM